MNEYKYCVSLRITHPEMDPDEITKTLGIQPFRKWVVGEIKTTPNGQELEGFRKESYWAASMHKEEMLSSDDICLEDSIANQNRILKPYARLFNQIADTGGHIEYFIGWFGADNAGATLEAALLKQISDLRIAISIDLYIGRD